MNIGEKFEFKGMEWVVLDLDGDKVTAIVTELLESAPFDDQDWMQCTNNWKDCTLRKRLQESLVPVIGRENLIPHVTDLVADNGDDRYSTVEDLVWLLSCDEFRKYRKIILENCHYDDWYWTVTPWYITDVGHGSYVRSIDPSGSVYYTSAYNGYGVAPACVFHLASLTSAPTGAPQEE